MAFLKAAIWSFTWLVTLPSAMGGPRAGNRRAVCGWNPLGPLRLQQSRDVVCGPVIDDTTNLWTEQQREGDEAVTDQHRWGPWTDKPLCHDGTAVKGIRYCTFTDVSFRSGEGLSIIGTPELVAGFAQDALVDPLVPWDPKRCPLHIPGTYEPEQGPPYTVVEVPGKGLGVIANRLIRAGEILMVDHPMILADVGFPTMLNLTQGKELLRVAVERLPNKEKVLSLAGSTGGEVIQDIFRTNTFDVGINNVSYMGLYPRISRINHACSPNTFSRFHPSDLTMDIGAIRDIQPSEEITVSYIPLGLPSWDRQRRIIDWGFSCTCDLCSSPDDNELSDMYRARLSQLQLQVQNHQTIDYDTLVDISKELLKLIEIESLVPRLGDYYESLSMAFEGKADLDSAVMFERLSLEMWLLYGGEDHDHVPSVERRLAMLERRRE